MRSHHLELIPGSGNQADRAIQEEGGRRHVGAIISRPVEARVGIGSRSDRAIAGNIAHWDNAAGPGVIPRRRF